MAAAGITWEPRSQLHKRTLMDRLNEYLRIDLMLSFIYSTAKYFFDV